MALHDAADHVRKQAKRRTPWLKWDRTPYAYREDDITVYTWTCTNGDLPALQDPGSLIAAGYNCESRGCEIALGDTAGQYTETYVKEGTITYV
jgi:hypothetical protein